MGGWPEEAYYSIYRIGISRALQNKPWIEIQQAFLDAYAARPTRAEPLYQIARIYRMNGKPALCYLFAKMAADIPYPKEDILFIDNDVYKYGILDEIGSTAFYAGKVEIGYNACKALLDRNLMPASEIERVKNNLKEYERGIVEMQKRQVEQKIEKRQEVKKVQKEKPKAFKKKERSRR